MTLTTIITIIVPILIIQGIGGIVAVVKMWGTQLQQQQEIENLKADVKDLSEGDKIGAANMTGLSSQLAMVNAGLGEIKGQLSILVADRHISDRIPKN